MAESNVSSIFTLTCMYKEVANQVTNSFVICYETLCVKFNSRLITIVDREILFY